jgi:excisionase family DNA binding protein
MDDKTARHVLNMHEAASYLGISYSRFARHYREWGIASYRVGAKLINFDRHDLNAYLDSGRCGAPLDESRITLEQAESRAAYYTELARKLRQRKTEQ